MHMQTFQQRADWQEQVNSFLLATLQGLLQKHEIVRILLSGGSTPKDSYTFLGKSDLPWERIELYQADERYVSSASADLNANMLKATLLGQGQKFDSVHFFDTSLTQAEAVEQYEQLLQNLPRPIFHLAILGVGPDGHTASLFPGSEALHENKLVTSSTTDVFAGKDRLTLTPTALNESEQVIILATGPDKASIVERFKANTETIDDLPILCVRSHPSVALFYSEEK